MKNRIIGFAALAAIALAPVGAYAQGIERGAAQGADEGGAMRARSAPLSAAP